MTHGISRNSEWTGARGDSVAWGWGALLLGWLIALCVIPDPRPLGAHEWAVQGLQSLTGVSEPGSRAVATIVLRGAGLAGIGILLALVLRRVALPRAAPLVLAAAPLLGVAVQWVNYGYFPIAAQLQLGLASTLLGALAGLALRRSRLALATLAIVSAGLLAWGTSTGISDDLYESARVTGLHVLDHAESVPQGDAGFAEITQLAFTFAEDNSHGGGGVAANRAAILALGVILGEERVARVAKRPLELERRPEIEALRQRITLRGRKDLPRHFWVSAALAVLSGGGRSMTVGIAKEMMDATPGGSGFSFVDLVADRAGTLFTEVATRNEGSAHALQLRIRDGVEVDEFFPEVRDLPEGLSRDQFQAEYGGLGGTGTQRVVEEIRRRLAQCDGLR